MKRNGRKDRDDLGEHHTRKQVAPVTSLGLSWFPHPSDSSSLLLSKCFVDLELMVGLKLWRGSPLPCFQLAKSMSRCCSPAAQEMLEEMLVIDETCLCVADRRFVR